MSEVPTRHSLRQRLGALLLDLPRTLPLLVSRDGWVEASNRIDMLKRAPDRRAFACMSDSSSDLHACQVYPSVGRLLMKQALRQWPVRFAESGTVDSSPEVTFVIPHRGLDRLPLLLEVVRSVLGQTDAKVECIVVEQSAARELHDLPPGVRYIHLPHPHDPEPWRKSWALNVGVAAARAGIVICHDGDLLVPSGYASEVLKYLRDGKYDVAFLQRFRFYMKESANTPGGLGNSLAAGDCERVNQNCLGGVLAIRKSAYFLIGGFDEDFVGWGGEDDEFYDRCSLLRRYAFGYLPFPHLWHAPQPTKLTDARDAALEMKRRKLETPASERARKLKARLQSSLSEHQA